MSKAVPFESSKPEPFRKGDVVRVADLFEATVLLDQEDSDVDVDVDRVSVNHQLWQSTEWPVLWVRSSACVLVWRAELDLQAEFERLCKRCSDALTEFARDPSSEYLTDVTERYALDLARFVHGFRARISVRSDS